MFLFCIQLKILLQFKTLIFIPEMHEFTLIYLKGKIKKHRNKKQMRKCKTF